MKKILFFSLFFFTASCAENVLTISNKTTEIGRQHGFEKKIYQTKNFKIFTLQKISSPFFNPDLQHQESQEFDTRKTLRIYFEGDGHAFVNKRIISANPTPTSYFLINLITQDPSPNILYIARPCQFVSDKKCQQKYWTNARFSEEILSSVNRVVKNFSEFKLELIGYSGGAEVAKYVAAKNKNTVSIRTIAGNLDHKKFTELHHVSALNESFNDEEILPTLAEIPQIHFVGSKDKVTPRAVAESYLEKLPNKSCTQIISVEGATHSKGWLEKWSQLLEIKPICLSLQ